MVVEEVRRTSVCAREKSNGKRWRVYFYAINISNTNTDIHAQSTREKLDRNKLHVGETICFLGKNDQETYGIITQLNPKTASVITRDGTRWRVDYRHLFKILDADSQDVSPRTMIDVTLIE